MAFAMKEQVSTRMTIVTSSCDQYADLLGPFSQLFKKYWKDCQYPSVLVTESKPAIPEPNAFDKMDGWGSQTPWSDRLLFTLRELNTPYILLVLDDFLMCGPFSNEQAERYLDILQEHNAAAIRLAPLPKPQREITPEYGEYVKGKAYRVSAQVGIWNRSYLISLLEELSPSELWNFERSGSFVSEKHDAPFLGTYAMVFPYIEMICKARWLSSGLKFCKREGVTLDVSKRETEPRWFLLYRQVRGVIFRINPTLITKVKLRLTNGAKGR